MGRHLTFKQLRTEKGWPHSRQWTNSLVRAKKIPAPKKRPGGSVNVWDETEWDAYQDTFVRVIPQPIQFALTAALVEAISSTSIDTIVESVGQFRTILEREGATANDVIVGLKASLATKQAAAEVSAVDTG
jgi:hypothetical protein